MKKSYVRSMVESQNKSFNETGHDPIDNLVSSLLQYDEDEVYKNLDDRLK